MMKTARYDMTPARCVFRDYLRQLTLYDMADIALKNENLKIYLEKFISDYLARSMTTIDLKNILADEIGAKEYFERLKAIESESKTKRLNVLLQPSVHTKVKDRATVEGTSVNELINQAVKEFLERQDENDTK